MKKKISAEIIADSIDKRGNRITSFVLTYPRFIHAEIMTHRMFSRNSASSRAIPFEKMVKSVEEDPFIPIAWQKDHKGMQGLDYIDINDNKFNEGPELYWRQAAISAVNMAMKLNKHVGVTKQLCNRLLEPFLWHTIVLTATEFENFFELRCAKYRMVNDSGVTTHIRSKKDYLEELSTIDYEIMKNYSFEQWMKINDSGAEIHMQVLAESMWDAYNDSTPKTIEEGQWHLPFGDSINKEELKEYLKGAAIDGSLGESIIGAGSRAERKIATARIARVSYMTFEGDIDYKKDIELHDMLLQNKHLSPFDHCAQAMTEYEYHRFVKGEEHKMTSGWCEMYRGFKSYRYVIQNELPNNIK